MGPLSGYRIGLLTASASRNGGGVFEAVAAHAAMVRAMGGEAVVFALRDEHSEADRSRFGASPVTTCPVTGPRQVGYSPGLLPALLEARLDCLHLHGIWMYPSAAASGWAGRTGKPYFISPHGMLDPWITARGTAKKALARLVYERRSWRRAHTLHALTTREARDIANETGRDDTVVIPNAGPPPTAEPRGFPAPHLVYIGRIHSKKNLASLVGGWFGARRPAGARLTIAGWGDEPSIAELNAAILRGDGSATYVGPVYGEAKNALLAQARFVVLPSHSEGLPMAILESWAADTPTIMTGECNLPEGFAAGAALECGYTPVSIARTLEQALDMSEPAWRMMALAGRNLALGPFSAQTIAARWAEIYKMTIDNARREAD